MEKDKVGKLYECYQILADAKDKIGEHETEYLQILKSVKGEKEEKILAAQFIPRFFNSFTSLRDTALDALLDLVEDPELIIRKQAIKNLPSICKCSSSFIPKVADILTQMLQCDDTSELATVNFSLVTIMKLDLKGTLAGLFSQITSTEDELVRKRAITFICTKLRFLPADMVSKDIEEYVLQECKKVFQDVTDEEFSSFMSLLSSFKFAKTIAGQIMLVDLIAEQVELDKEFNHESSDNALCLLQCIRQALPFFTAYVSSAPFVKYLILQVLPVLKELSSLGEEIDISLELIKLLAEISPYCNNLEDSKTCLEKLYNFILDYMPVPPVEGIDNEKLVNEPNLQFTHIECLMYTFHQLSKKYPDYLKAEANADRFKDFKQRLHFLARSIQACTKSIRESIVGEKGKATKNEDNKLKSAALRTMTNISSLIKDFFHNPPSFKSTITLSWKPTASTSTPAAVAAPLKKPTDSSVPSVGVKRKEITAPEESTKPAKREFKGQRQIYSPPGGKYSSNVKKYYPAGGYYRNRGRGGRQQFY